MDYPLKIPEGNSPVDSHLLVFILGIRLVHSPPTLSRADLCNQQDIVEIIECGFQEMAIKNIAAFIFLSLGSLALGKASHHTVSRLTQLHGEIHVRRT